MATKMVSLVEEIQNIDYIPAYMTDDEGNVTVWNQNAQKLLKYSESEILGASENKLFFNPNEATKILGVRFTWRTDKEGKQLFVQETTIGVTDPESPQHKFMKILDDYTSQLTVSEQCELWLEHHRALDQAAIISTNTEPMQVAFLTEQMASLLGYEVHELLGQPVDKIVAPVIASNALGVSEEITGNPSTPYKFNFFRKDGSVLSVIVNGIKVQDQTGRAFFLGQVVPIMNATTEASEAFLAP